MAIISASSYTWNSLVISFSTILSVKLVSFLNTLAGVFLWESVMDNRVRLMIDLEQVHK